MGRPLDTLVDMARTKQSPDDKTRAASGPTTPLLRDHLPKKSRQVSPESGAEAAPPPELPEPEQGKASGRETRSPDEIATRRHLEGAEQGPM